MIAPQRRSQACTHTSERFNRFYFEEIEFEMPSVRLARAEAAIDSYREMPFMLSSPLALCQRKHAKASLRKHVATARINRTEC